MMMRLHLQLLAQQELLTVLMLALGGLPSTHFSVTQRPN
jgi:acid phosphatase family membrane protein YuiD